MNTILNSALAGKLDTKTANTAGYLINLTLNALRQDEQERRIDELEEKLRDMELK